MIEERLNALIQKCEDLRYLIKSTERIGEADREYYSMGLKERIKACQLTMDFERNRQEQSQILAARRRSISEHPPGIILPKDCDKMQKVIDIYNETILQEVLTLEKSFDTFKKFVCEQEKLD